MKHESFIEVYSFATSRSFPSLTEFFLNNQKILTDFIHYFKITAFPFIDVNDTKKLAVFKDTVDVGNHSKITNKNEINFLDNKKICEYPFVYNDKVVNLSRQQFLCLHYLSQGKTAKQIAQILNISYRTVEVHLYNIKKRTDLCDKSSLISMFNNNYEL